MLQLLKDFYEDETFEGVNAEGASLAGKEFVGCTFKSARMQQSRWQGARLEECTFEACDLTGMNPSQLALRGVKFLRCKLMGVSWTALEPFPDVEFVECLMRYSSFVGAELTAARFTACSLLDSSFVEANLSKAIFKDCDMAQTQFDQCALIGADFSSSRGVFFDVAKNRSKGARISVETAALMAVARGLRVSGYERNK